MVPAASETVFYSECSHSKNKLHGIVRTDISKKRYMSLPNYQSVNVIAELSICHLHLMDDVSDKYVHCY